MRAEVPPSNRNASRAAKLLVGQGNHWFSGGRSHLPYVESRIPSEPFSHLRPISVPFIAMMFPFIIPAVSPSDFVCGLTLEPCERHVPGQ